MSLVFDRGGGGGELGASASPGRQLLRGVARYSFKERSDRVEIFWRLNLYADHSIFISDTVFIHQQKKINLNTYSLIDYRFLVSNLVRKLITCQSPVKCWFVPRNVNIKAIPV